MVLNTVSLRVVTCPVAPLNAVMRASATSPNFSRPSPSFTVHVIGTRSTATTSPMSAARSAIAPPNWPVNTFSSASCCSCEHRSSTYTTAFQLPPNTLPGMCTAKPMTRSATSTPSMVPPSTAHAKTESQVPVSGSRPTQHGQIASQLQTSSSLPSISYLVAALDSVSVAVIASLPVTWNATATAAACPCLRGATGSPVLGKSPRETAARHATLRSMNLAAGPFASWAHAVPERYRQR